MGGTLPNENILLTHYGTSGPVFCEAEGEEGWLPFRNIGQCRYWNVGPRLYQSISVGTGMLGIASINVTALTLCRKKQSEVFGKWPCINFHMGLKPYDAKCQ